MAAGKCCSLEGDGLGWLYKESEKDYAFGSPGIWIGSTVRHLLEARPILRRHLPIGWKVQNMSRDARQFLGHCRCDRVPREPRAAIEPTQEAFVYVL